MGFISPSEVQHGIHQSLEFGPYITTNLTFQQLLKRRRRWLYGSDSEFLSAPHIWFTCVVVFALARCFTVDASRNVFINRLKFSMDIEATNIVLNERDFFIFSSLMEFSSTLSFKVLKVSHVAYKLVVSPEKFPRIAACCCLPSSSRKLWYDLNERKS